MFSSIPIRIHLTTSINIRLTHGSRTTVANTRFHKKARLIRKSFRKRLLVSLSNPIQSQKKSLYIHGHPNNLPPNGGDYCPFSWTESHFYILTDVQLFLHSSCCTMLFTTFPCDFILQYYLICFPSGIVPRHKSIADRKLVLSKSDIQVEAKGSENLLSKLGERSAFRVLWNAHYFRDHRVPLR